jgi:hypothetical protein
LTGRHLPPRASRSIRPFLRCSSAAPAVSRAPPLDGSLLLFLYDSFIHNSMPVYPGALSILLGLKCFSGAVAIEKSGCRGKQPRTVPVSLPPAVSLGLGFMAVMRYLPDGRYLDCSASTDQQSALDKDRTWEAAFPPISSDSWPGPAIQRIVRPVRRKSSVNGNSGLSSTGGTPIVPAVWPVS